MFKKPKGTLLHAEFTKISNGPKQDDDASFTSKKRQEQNKKGAQIKNLCNLTEFP